MLPNTNTASQTVDKRPDMIRSLLVAGAIIAVFLGSHVIRNQMRQGSEANNLAKQPPSYQRVIALSPSIVEIIYQLDLEKQLVGVPRYANFPPEAKNKPCVGGYIDLQYEKVLELGPDCVILLKEQATLAEKLQHLGIHSITVDHNHTRGIIQSINTIGNELGHQLQAAQIVREIKTAINQLMSPYRNTPYRNTPYRNIPSKPRVLICISRDTTASHPEQVIIAGSAGFHRELVQMVGGSNAYQGSVSFPTMSREKLIELNPDVIIDLVNSDTWHNVGERRLLSQWQAYSELKAVSNQRVVIIHGDQHLIPGPRFPQTLEKFARAIHP